MRRFLLTVSLWSIAAVCSAQLGQFRTDEVFARTYGARTYSTLTNVISRIGAVRRTVILDGGAWTFNEALTIPSNITLRIAADAWLNMGASASLTIQGGFENAAIPVFTGAGQTNVTGLSRATINMWTSGTEAIAKQAVTGAGPVYFSGLGLDSAKTAWDVIEDLTFTNGVWTGLKSVISNEVLYVHLPNTIEPWVQGRIVGVFGQALQAANYVYPSNNVSTWDGGPTFTSGVTYAITNLTLFRNTRWGTNAVTADGDIFPRVPGMYQVNFMIGMTSTSTIPVEAACWVVNATNGVPVDYGPLFRFQASDKVDVHSGTTYFYLDGNKDMIRPVVYVGGETNIPPGEATEARLTYANLSMLLVSLDFPNYNTNHWGYVE